jgi:hypothetical protein
MLLLRWAQAYFFSERAHAITEMSPRTTYLMGRPHVITEMAPRLTYSVRGWYCINEMGPRPTYSVRRAMLLLRWASDLPIKQKGYI